MRKGQPNMLIELLGGKMDGTIEYLFQRPLSDKIEVRFGTIDPPELEPKQLIYRRKPDTNKFYFDKIEEV